MPSARTCAPPALRVDPAQVVFKQDDATGATCVEVLLRDAQMDWALQDNGRLVRQAAMDLGIDIEIGAAELPDEHEP